MSVVWGRMKRGVGEKERGKVGRKFRANKRVKGPFRENAEQNLFSPSDLKKFLSSVDQPLFLLGEVTHPFTICFAYWMTFYSFDIVVVYHKGFQIHGKIFE